MEFFDAYMPHGHCYQWTPSILWTTVVSDVLIAISYFSIPLALVYFARKREDLPFSWMFLLFGLFILACGTGHVFDVWNTWHGDYGAESIVKAVTAAASIGTAVALWPLLPRALALPSPSQLREANEALQREVETRRAAEASQREQSRELVVARDAAEAASRAKSQFLANMSHEIRTPLNAVIGLTEMLLNGELTEQQRDHLRTVQDSGEVLLHIVNDILDFSKIEAGRTELESISFDLEDAVGDALRSLAVRAGRKDLELLLSISDRVTRRLLGDPGRLRQVITNLVSNAITYTEVGEVEVSIDRASDEPTHLRFEVRDTGMGIAPEELERLFDPFEQADQSSTRRFGGTGLGLSICRGIVDLMGGEIWAVSEPGEGSTFCFTARFGVGEPIADGAARAAYPVDGTRALIVDDNETNRVILFALARRRGLQPVLAASASEALALLGEAAESEDPFRLVLTDLQMPGADGFELAGRIRARERYRDVAIVLLSSAGAPPDPKRCAELGIAARLAKPIKEYEFARTIGDVMGAPAAEQGADTGDEDASEPLSPLRILLVEDSVANQKVALAMLRDGHEVELASDGAEAVRLFENGAFDVVLMDVQMPVMDGYASTAAIRSAERETGTRVPIIAMTAHAMPGDRERCLEAGMDDYLSKPIRRAELMAMLARVRAGWSGESGSGAGPTG